jgi:large subunit ribosomal protein L23
MKIIKRPIFTEKTIGLIENYNQYMFDMDYRLTKSEIFLLIEKIFSIRIESINTYLPPRNKRIRGRITGLISIRKRVFITLKKGEKIAFFPKSLLIYFLLIYGFANFLYHKFWEPTCGLGLV